MKHISKFVGIKSVGFVTLILQRVKFKMVRLSLSGAVLRTLDK